MKRKLSAASITSMLQYTKLIPNSIRSMSFGWIFGPTCPSSSTMCNNSFVHFFTLDTGLTGSQPGFSLKRESPLKKDVDSCSDQLTLQHKS